MNDWDQDIYHLNDEQPQPSRGSLLVAKPTVGDFFFKRSLVLIVDPDEGDGAPYPDTFRNLGKVDFAFSYCFRGLFPLNEAHNRHAHIVYVEQHGSPYMSDAEREGAGYPREYPHHPHGVLLQDFQNDVKHSGHGCKNLYVMDNLCHSERSEESIVPL